MFYEINHPLAGVAPAPSPMETTMKFSSPISRDCFAKRCAAPIGVATKWSEDGVWSFGIQWLMMMMMMMMVDDDDDDDG